MYLIGVEGKSGSGKSKTCDILEQNYGVAHIKVDHLMYLNGLMDELNSILDKLYNDSNKILPIDIKSIFKILVLKKKVDQLIEKELKRLEEEGNEFASVDFAYLNILKCSRKFNMRFFTHCNDTERDERRIIRDGTDKYLKADDAFLSIFKYNLKRSQLLDNNGSLEDLKEQLENIFSEIQAKQR